MADARVRTLIAAAALAAATTLMAPAGADAARIAATIATGSSGEDVLLLSYEGSDDERNQVSISGSDAGVTITEASDTTFTNVSSGRCTETTAKRVVTCAPQPGGLVARLDVDLGASPSGPESISSTVGGVEVTYAVSSPQSTVTGGPAPETMRLGPGATATGGEGDDAFVAEGDATLDGGPGDDAVSTTTGGTAQDGLARPVTFRLDANAATTGNGIAGQQLTLSGIEDAMGGPGDDTLIGSAAANTLAGFGGSDTIDGGAGRDRLYGGKLGSLQALLGAQPSDTPDGVNAFLAQDGETDRVDCTGSASGTTVQADAADVVLACPAEGAGTTITRPAPPAPILQPVPVPVPVPVPAAADATKPKAGKLTVPLQPKGKALRKTGRFTIAFTPSEAVTADVTLSATPTRVASIARAGEVVLAARTVRAAAGKRASLRLTVPKKLRKLLRKRRRLAVSITLTDAAGNATRITRKAFIDG